MNAKHAFWVSLGLTAAAALDQIAKTGIAAQLPPWAQATLAAANILGTAFSATYMARPPAALPVAPASAG